MKQEDLQRVVPGFDDPVSGSQTVFRRALQALSMPGRPVDVPAVAHLPSRGHGAAALLLLALLDSDCTLWLSASLRDSHAQAWLRFHTGCRCVDEPSQARFLWLAAGDEWPSLTEMNPGSDAYPDQSATCVMEVSSLRTGDGWRLSGPGVDGSLGVDIAGLPADFDTQWQANHSTFPRGVDVFVATGAQLLGLPRSTRLTRNDTVEA
ncbi:MAG: phosphonate C-P lyase system protein PhnH [Gammaproteobacteria bacterium]